MDLGSGRRRETRSAGSAGERVYLCTCHRALLVWPHTPVALKVTLQQGRSAAPFVSCPAQRSPALRARRASVSDSYLGARLPPVIVLSSLLLPVAARCLLLIYCTLACLACGRVALLCSALPHPVNQFDLLSAGTVHAFVRPADGLSYS